MTVEFSISTKLKALQLFANLCGKSNCFESLMNEKGFFVFKRLQDFEEEFGDGPSHYKFMQELGKETVGSYDGGIAAYIGENGTGYRSPYLCQLVQDRESRLGMDINEFRKLNPSTPWLLELDETRGERLKYQITLPVEFYRRKGEFDNKFAEEKKKEVKAVVKNDYGTIILSSYEEKFEALTDVLANCLSVLEMTPEKRFSSKKYPVFCKKLSEYVYLCCSFKNYDDLLIQPDSGAVELIFHLRIKDFKNSKIELTPHVEVKGHNKFLVIQSGAIIPYFVPTYSAFSSIEEFELNIMGQIMLFQLAYRKCEEDLLEIIYNNNM